MDLYTPSLSTDHKPPALYSPRSVFLVAFFGGAFAAATYPLLNSIRLKRLGLDAWVVVLMLVGYGFLLYWLWWPKDGYSQEAWLAVTRAKDSLYRYLPQAYALAGWMVFHFLHWPMQRAADLMAIPRPNPWVPALACIGGGIVLQALLYLTLNVPEVKQPLLQ